jgi:hypothetical protein
MGGWVDGWMGEEHLITWSSHHFVAFPPTHPPSPPSTHPHSYSSTLPPIHFPLPLQVHKPPMLDSIELKREVEQLSERLGKTQDYL